MKKLGWKKIRKIFEAKFEEIQSDAFGPDSIDPGKNEKENQKERIVNSFGPEIENALGIPIAIKGTGDIQQSHERWESLKDQYLEMRQLQFKFAKLPSKIIEVVNICPVYGLIIHGVESEKEYQEYLIMRRVPNARWLDPVDIQEMTFFASEHPRLIDAFDMRDDLGTGSLSIIEHDLVEQGIYLRDISNRNFLYDATVPPRHRTYTIIDQ